MDCTEARTLLLARRRGALAPDVQAAVEGHLAGCEACRREDDADAALSKLLEERLPRPGAPAALRRTIEQRFGPSPSPRPPRVARLARTVGAMVAGAAMAAGLFVWHARSTDDAMVAEAVSDHLRVLYSQHPLEVESGGVHQVKPWFEGRVDFAPVVRFGGDDDFPLQGGAIGYFIDRKAAVYLFKRRLHVITLFVFPSQGLRWPAATKTIGAAHASASTTRGFHTLLWREGDLGYALVSDVDERELADLGARIAGP